MVCLVFAFMLVRIMMTMHCGQTYFSSTPLNADVLQVRPLPSDKTAGAPHGEDRRQEGGGRNGWSGLSQAEENVSLNKRQAFQIQRTLPCNSLSAHSWDAMVGQCLLKLKISLG